MLYEKIEDKIDDLRRQYVLDEELSLRIADAIEGCCCCCANAAVVGLYIQSGMRQFCKSCAEITQSCSIKAFKSDVKNALVLMLDSFEGPKLFEEEKPVTTWRDLLNAELESNGEVLDDILTCSHSNFMLINCINNSRLNNFQALTDKYVYLAYSIDDFHDIVSAKRKSEWPSEEVVGDKKTDTLIKKDNTINWDKIKSSIVEQFRGAVKWEQE